MAESARMFTDADRAWRSKGPTARAVAAFGVRADALKLLPGGQGQTWTDGRLVLKAVGFVPEHDWICAVYADWTAHDEVRVPEPVRPAPMASEAADAWSVDGWGAHVFVLGHDIDPAPDLELIRRTSDIFHGHIAHLPRPDFLDVRDDPWAFGDRIAWEDAEPAGDARLLDLAAELRSHLTPLNSRNQAIHGDLLPNVLVADRLPPAVIDWPLYYRPAAFANAITLTDAVTFRGASSDLFDVWDTDPDWNQLLLRALLYRLGPTGFFTVQNSLMGSLVTHLQRVRPVAQMVITRVSG